MNVKKPAISAIFWVLCPVGLADVAKPAGLIPAKYGLVLGDLWAAWEDTGCGNLQSDRDFCLETSCLLSAGYDSRAIFSSWTARRSLFNARASICRIRSLVTPIEAPTSLSVWGSWE